jgi:hypothetical protein
MATIRFNQAPCLAGATLHSEGGRLAPPRASEFGITMVIHGYHLSRIQRLHKLHMSV